MKYSDKDNFEKFFHDNLKEYNSLPSDNLWTKLEDRIPPPPKSSLNKKIGGWLVLLIGIVFLFSLTQWWQQAKEIETINETLEKQEEKITSISNDLKNNLEQTNLVINNFSKEKRDVSLKNITTSKNSNTPKTKTPAKATNENSENTFGKIDDVDSENVSSLLERSDGAEEVTKNISPSITLESSVLLQDEKQEINFSKVGTIETINSLNILVDAPIKELKPINPSLQLLDFSSSKVKGSFEIYRNTSFLYPQLKLADQVIPTTNLPSKNIDVGILYNLKLNKRVILQFGVSYAKQSTGLQFKKTFEYAETETLLDNNVTETKYRYQFNTNYGRQIFDTFILNQKENDGQDLATNDLFTMDIQVTRRQRYLTTPVIFKYLWHNENDRFKGSFKVGMFQRFSFFLDERADVVVKSISHPRLTYDRTNAKQVGFSSTKDLSFMFGAGLECRLDDRLYLIIEPTFTKSILSIDEVLPHTLGIYTGLRWDIFQ